MPDAARFENPEFLAGYKAGHQTATRKYTGVGDGGQKATVPCSECRAPDARDTAHAAGCPMLPKPSKAELLALALLIEAGWRTDHAPKERAA